MGDKSKICQSCGRWSEKGWAILEDGTVFWTCPQCMRDEIAEIRPPRELMALRDHSQPCEHFNQPDRSIYVTYDERAGWQCAIWGCPGGRDVRFRRLSRPYYYHGTDMNGDVSGWRIGGVQSDAVAWVEIPKEDE